ncbi:kinase-like domain-containing protein [Rhizophagus clarus]|uniref:Kinase-like domain-containing protein n=1 Tax=Rhizophagus clarus TaxID=94130 RepID=A0A8H3QK23_9GLOM|nr:kinase-like domain-containing protein [Rhizophagus clarus]
MATIRYESILSAIQRANALIDYYENYNDLDTQHKFQRQTVLDDKSLTEYEKTEAVKELNKIYDRNKVDIMKENYLKWNFSNWTSENNDVDNLIQKFQIESLGPDKIVEWIPYNNLQHIKYLTEGGFSEIYTAVWICGKYEEWDSKEQKLKRLGDIEVVLKSLYNVESASRSWFEEAKSHLIIGNKWPQHVQCFGLTQDPINGNYMLVMYKMDMNLREYLHRTHNKLTWKEKIKIVYDIILALSTIHRENAIHRDLHSGNVLYLQLNQKWYINDFGFCGPANNSSNSIYGNLPYIAPEVISGKGFTFASDIYSIAMLMWEISSGQPPFNDHKDDYDLALKIINGMRPKIVLGTPIKYVNLMKKCWDADPSRRPDINTLIGVFIDMYENTLDELPQPKTEDRLELKSSISSKIYYFENLPEPRNAAGAFDSRLYDLYILDDIDDFNRSNIQRDNNSSKIINIFKDSSKEFLKVFQQEKKDDDDDEINNNPNLHSEEQDELEIRI